MGKYYTHRKKMKQVYLILLIVFYLISCRTASKVVSEKKEIPIVEIATFIGTKWILSSLNKRLPTFSMNEKPYLLFKNDNEFSGNAGCNNFSGTYEKNDSLIIFKNILVTTSACPDLPIESDFLKALSRTNKYSKGNQELELKDPTGNAIALFLAK